MAHVMKFTKAACGHMFKHYERAKDENGEYIKFGNESIDTSRIQNNYNLAPVHQNGQGEFIRQRCGEVRMQNRKDVNVMCSWVVTAPKDLPQEDERQFFESTYKFLSNRYGKDNTVSAHVHMDEVTPHMHYAFVPVVENKKKGGYKVSAKEAVNLRDLQTFHNDLSEYLQRVFGREINVLNEATKEGNKTIEELKRGTLIQEAQEARETIDRATELRSLIPDLIEQRNAQESKIKELQSELEKLEASIKQEQKNFTDMQMRFKPRQDDLQRVNKLAKEVKPPILSRKVSLSKDDWDFIINIAEQHARISDATLAALENQSEVTEKLKNCQRLYLALSSELGAITHYGDREKLKHAVQDVLKDIEDWRVVSWIFDDMINRKPSSLEDMVRAREAKISKKHRFAKENKEYNQESIVPKKRKQSQERD